VVIEALLTARRQEVGRVADPGLEGGQVAVLRLHAASSRRVTFAAYSRKGAQSRARIALSEVRRMHLLERVLQTRIWDARQVQMLHATRASLRSMMRLMAP
jgi:hypothetical protein